MLSILQLGQNPDQIHAIGHSLGAHLVGRIGRSVENEPLGHVDFLSKWRILSRWMQ